MKRVMIRIKLLLIGLSAIMLTGCVTFRADSSSLSSPDYNQRVVVNNPHYDGVLNPIGVTSLAASTVAGGYLGYQSDLIKINNGTDQTTFKIGNAAIGAAVGFGTSYVFNRLLGWGKVKKVDSKWMNKANKNFKVISGNSNSVYVIPKNIESQFKIMNIEDANQFVSVFNTSKYSDEAFRTGIENCKRQDLPELVNIFSTSKFTTLAKEKYIETSPSYEDIASATTQYNEIKNDYERNFLQLINKCNNAIDFKSRYPNSAFFKQSYLYAYKTDNQPISDFKTLNNQYSNTLDLSINDFTKESPIIQRNFMLSRYQIEEPKTTEDVISIYNKYIDLRYISKETDLLNTFFNIAENTISDGSIILGLTNQLSDRSIYPTLSLSTSVVSTFIKNKLADEVEKNVVLIPKIPLANYNQQWKDWEKSHYTAGMVAQLGAMFLINGEVKNNSKFDLPVIITGSGDLQYSGTIKGLNETLRKIDNVARTFGVTTGLGEVKALTNVGNKAGDFYGILPSNSTAAYAIPLNFTDNYAKVGINLLDWIKYEQVANLINVDTKVNFSNYQPSINSDVIKNQEYALSLAITGLPNVNLVDLRRGSDVDPDAWKERDRIRQEKIREAQEYARTHPSINRNFSSDNVSENKLETKNDDGQDDNKKPNRLTKYEKDNEMPEIKKSKIYNDNENLLVEFEDDTIVDIKIKKNGYYIRAKNDLAFNGSIYKNKDDAIRAAYYAEKFGFYSVQGRE